MVDNASHKHSPGRPQAINPDEALDRAVDMFWAHEYEGVDVDRIARAIHVTKPALYRAFGDKPTLFMKAVERYAERFGVPMIEAFLAEPDVRKAVLGFCEATVGTATDQQRIGCLMASAALGQSKRVDEIRAFIAHGLVTTVEIFTKRFQKEIRAKRLSSNVSAKTRARALVDLMQGVLLRAKAGTPRTQLMADAVCMSRLFSGDFGQAFTFPLPRGK